MSWKPEVQVVNDPKWYNNNLAFETEEEAKYSALELADRWMAVVETRAVESDQVANYRIDLKTGEMTAILVAEAKDEPGQST